MEGQFIHLFRHAEAHHNAEDNIHIRDPLLTPEGIRQCQGIIHQYNYLRRPTLILVSPLRRCIDTALYAFHPDFNPDVQEFFPPPRILAMPHLQETTENPCDTGSTLELLKKQYGEHVEFNEMFFTSNDWLMKSGTCFANDNILLSRRSEFVRNVILQQTDDEIIVVTHGDFSHFLVNRWLYGPGCGSLFNGLAHGTGIPMVLMKNESHSEMRVEIPPWIR